MNTLFTWLLPLCGVAAIGYFNRNTPRFSRLVNLSARLLSQLGHTLSAAGARIREFNYPANPNAFSDLTPSNDIDPQYIYDKRINHAIHMPQIKNVALTGPYGSGKSSILLTFQKRHPEFQYLNISLASLKEIKDDDDKMYELVEASILQQIFYRVRYKEIPKSRFKRINKQSWPQLSLKVALIMLFLGSIAIFWKKDQTLAILRLTDFTRHHPDLIFTVQLLSILTTVFLLFYTTLKIYSNSKLHKLSLSSGEIELATDDASILNKHLDEILYFFEATKYSVVIFEDLDRFNKPEIFTKLREINALLNNSLQINRKITFIYALKDEMFKDESRTKFFDFIIPVIPVISSLNSADLLIQKITALGLTADITPQFLRNISLFIDDMRLLKNIFNEFQLYKDQFSDSGIKIINLFSIVLYKNIAPEDFALLQNDQGVTADIFKEKPRYIQALIEYKNQSITNIEEKLKRLKDSIPEDIKELRLMYFGALITKLPNGTVNQLQVNGTGVALSNILADPYFDRLATQSNSITYNGPYGWANTNISFKDVEAAVRPGKTYKDQANDIREGKQRTIESLTREKERLQFEISQVRSFSMKQIMATTDAVANQPDLKNNPLLSFLIKNGYIDEQFPFYAAYFYEGTLTKDDLAFVLSVKKNTPMPFTAPLTNIANVLEYLSPLDFSSDASLNFQLTSYLIANSEKYADHWLGLLKHVSTEQPRPIEFYEEYLHTNNDVAKFVVDLDDRYWQSQCDFILNRSGYSTDRKDFHLKILLSNFSIERIQHANSHADISKYLKDRQDFLVFASNLDLTKMKEIIQALDIHFTHLEATQDCYELLKFIYDNSYYALNQEMISLMIKIFGKTGHASSETYDDILNSGCTPLINYTDSNFPTFIKDVYLTHPSYRSEPERSLWKVIGNESLDQETKEDVLKATTTTISEIGVIQPDLWPTAINAHKIKVRWENIIYYYGRYHIDNKLENYLNDKSIQASLLSKPIESSEATPDSTRAFFADLITNPDISDTVVTAVSKVPPYTFQDFDLSTLSTNRLTILINHKVIILTPENYQHFSQKDNADSLKALLILQHPREFLSSISQYPINPEIAANLVTSPVFDLADKNMLLNTLSPDDITEATANELTNVVLKQKLSPQKALFEKLLISITNKSLAASLLLSPRSEVQPELISTYLTTMGEPYSTILSRYEVELIFDEDIQPLLQFLKDNNLIAEYKKEKKTLIVTPLSPPPEQPQ